MTQILLRKFNVSDREIFYEMSRDFYSCGAAHSPIPDENRASFWTELLSGKYIDGYIIEFNGATAGYALIAYYVSQEYGGKIALFDELYIKPEFRGKGIGKEIFSFVESKDVVACRLEVEPNNERALKLYRELGYKEFNYLQISKKLK